MEVYVPSSSGISSNKQLCRQRSETLTSRFLNPAGISSSPAPVSNTITHGSSSFALSIGIAEHIRKVKISPLVLLLCDRVNHANLSEDILAAETTEDVNISAFASSAKRNDCTSECVKQNKNENRKNAAVVLVRVMRIYYNFL